MVTHGTEQSAKLTDTCLAERIKRGDCRAFSWLFDRYYSRLCDYAARFCNGDLNLAKDIVQDVFIRIWERRESWSPTININGYLFRSVHNQAVSELRKRKGDMLQIDAQVLKLCTDELTPIENLQNEELRGTIMRALGMLPPRRREILVMRLLNEMSYQEIAASLSISVNTVDTQLRRALLSLRSDLYAFAPVSRAS